MPGNPLLPPMDEENEPFWEGARRGELRVQRCVDTGRLIFPPRSHSPWGEHRPPEWIALSGRGALWSYVIPHPPLLPYFADRAPYNVIVVSVEEDPSIRLVGNLVEEKAVNELSAVDAGQLQIGARVRVVFDPEEPEIPLPRWVVDDEPAT